MIILTLMILTKKQNGKTIKGKTIQQQKAPTDRNNPTDKSRQRIKVKMIEVKMIGKPLVQTAKSSQRDKPKKPETEKCGTEKCLHIVRSTAMIRFAHQYQLLWHVLATIFLSHIFLSQLLFLNNFDFNYFNFDCHVLGIVENPLAAFIRWVVSIRWSFLPSNDLPNLGFSSDTTIARRFRRRADRRSAGCATR